MLLSLDELRPFHNHSTQMAALDYLVSVASDVFIPSYDGNMARVVEGHRRYAYILFLIQYPLIAWYAESRFGRIRSFCF